MYDLVSPAEICHVIVSNYLWAIVVGCLGSRRNRHYLESSLRLHFSNNSCYEENTENLKSVWAGVILLRKTLGSTIGLEQQWHYIIRTTTHPSSCRRGFLPSTCFLSSYRICLRNVARQKIRHFLIVIMRHLVGTYRMRKPPLDVPPCGHT